MADLIGFVGLGQMGRPMASNLVRKGFDLIVFDLQRESVDAVAALGARAAGSAAEVATHSKILFTMLPNSPHVQAVIEGEVLPNMKPGGIVVDMSTIDPGTTDRLAGQVEAAGLAFVDAPVGRTTAFAERGESLFMVGAAGEQLDIIRPMLEAMGTTIIHCGGPGSGVRIKIVNNFVAVGLCQLNAEALTLGAALGLDINVELEVMTGTLATNGFLTTGFPDKTLAGDIEPGFQIDLAHKDISIAIDTANRLRVPLSVGAAVRESLNVARARGYGGKDFTGLLDSLTDLTGLTKPMLKR